MSAKLSTAAGGTLVNYMVKDKRSNISRVCGENENKQKKQYYKVTEEQGDGTAVLHICLAEQADITR